jgi:hypothetical protein
MCALDVRQRISPASVPSGDSGARPYVTDLAPGRVAPSSAMCLPRALPLSAGIVGRRYLLRY